MDENILTFDTTLRDGEQSPGISMSLNEKLTIVKKLETSNVDIAEVGFAASSPTDYEVIRKVSFTISDSTTCSLARVKHSDIQLASDTLKFSRRPRIHTFIASSDLHIRGKLGLNKKSVKEKAKLAVRFARRFTDDTEFSPEDCSRSNNSYLVELLGSIIEEGLTVLNVTDTVGYCLPEAFGKLTETIRSTILNTDRVIMSVHCHNDLGLALANTIAGLKVGGAKQVECTVNGIGERAGNTALEELVMVIKLKTVCFQLGVLFNPKALLPLSALVSKVVDYPIPLIKPIVGPSAFSHASGIHQDGVLKDRRTYEIINAEDVGWQKSKIVLSRLSGFSGFNGKLQELNISLGVNAVRQLFEKFKGSAITKKPFRTTDLMSFLCSVGRRITSNSNANQVSWFCYTNKITSDLSFLT